MRKFLLSITGYIAGFLSGLLGIGGGVIFVPSLTLILKFDIKDAATLSLVAIIPSIATGIIMHNFYVDMSFSFKIFFLILVGSIPGAKMGAFISSKISSRFLSALFFIFMIIMGGRLLGVFNLSITNEAFPFFPYLIVLGFIAGSGSALFGIGGGVILVPVLNIFFAMDFNSAIAMSLSVILPTIIAGIIFHSSSREINYKMAIYIIPFSIIGAFIGSYLSIYTDAVFLKKILGILLMLISLRAVFIINSG